jgi:hypothetical protein
MTKFTKLKVQMKAKKVQKPTAKAAARHRSAKMAYHGTYRRFVGGNAAHPRNAGEMAFFSSGPTLDTAPRRNTGQRSAS